MHPQGRPDKGPAGFESSRRVCQVLLLHDDFAAYTQAAALCRRMMDQLDREMDFEVKGWSFLELADADCARHAAKAASLADLLLIAVQTLPIPASLDQWLDFSFAGRLQSGGVLVLAPTAAAVVQRDFENLATRLERCATRMRLQFLGLPPGFEPGALPLPDVLAALQRLKA